MKYNSWTVHLPDRHFAYKHYNNYAFSFDIGCLLWYAIRSNDLFYVENNPWFKKPASFKKVIVAEICGNEVWLEYV